MKILIVEDNQKLAEGIQYTLKQHGFLADIVNNGKTAENRLQAYHEDYRLVALDLVLPEKNGLEVLKQIRHNGITLPVLILTGQKSPDDIVAGFEAGADDYLTKPFEQREFLARVKALLRRPRHIAPVVLQTKNLTLNVNTRKVFCHDKEVLLTLKEFSLLEYLMSRKGQVVSKEQILSNLWDFDFGSFSNVVEAHIKNLRKKLNCPKYEKVLETIRGVGYRIVD